jgi:hypothetical protein
MSINKGKYNKAQYKYIRENKFIDKDICDKIRKKYGKEDKAIDKDICDEIYGECIEEDKFLEKDVCDEIHEDYIEEYKFLDKDMCDEIHEEYMEEDEFFDKDVSDKYIEKDTVVRKFAKDNNKKTDDYSHPEETKIYVNCKLKVDFDVKNKMIYLYPGKTQYFTVDVTKCCGDVTIKYKDRYPSGGIRGNLGIYKIVQSGIIVETYGKLDPRKKDFLNFIAIDECTKECYEFVVVFSPHSVGCCY